MSAATDTELNVIERSAVIRIVRLAREHMMLDLGHLQVQARLGDKVADSAAVTLQAEVSILESAIRKLWLAQPGHTWPPPC